MAVELGEGANITKHLEEHATKLMTEKNWTFHFQCFASPSATEGALL